MAGTTADMLTIQVRGAEEERARVRQYRTLIRGRIRSTLQAQLTEAVASGRSQLGGGGGPQRRSGRLQRSFRFRIRPLRNVVRARLGFLGRGVGYAWTQEYGADIRPKSDGYLLVPLPAALTSTGRRSLRVRRQMEAGNTFVRGNVVYERRGPRTAPVPLFVLKKFIHVPPRPTLGPTWRRLEPRLVARLQDAILAPPRQGERA